LHNVGQVLFTIIKNGGNRVIPIKIVEKVTTTNLSEELIEYRVILPFKDSKKISLDKFDKYFNSLEEVNEFLLNNAKNTIKKIINDAKELNDIFDDDLKEENLDVKSIDNIKCKEEDEFIIIDLGDGKKGKIKPDFVAS